MPKFEPYDYRLGCVAVSVEGAWWVVKPNGAYEKAAGQEDAQTRAAYLNATKTPKEEREWRRQNHTVNPKT